MTDVKPTLGRIVLYVLGEGDVAEIDRLVPMVNAAGRQARNAVHPGQALPAMVVAAFGGSTVNLSVQLDGIGTYWATSRQEGTVGADGSVQLGRWHWPPRV